MFKGDLVTTVTSAHVAKLAEVSRATVSRVFNDSAHVSPELRERVHEAVARLGYEPDQAARSLVGSRSRTLVIGFFSHDSWSLDGIGQSAWYFYLSILRDLEVRTRDLGFDLLLPSQPLGQGSAGYVQSLRARRAAGVLIAGTVPRDPRVGALIEAELPTVFIDLPVRGRVATYVTSDNAQGSTAVAEHLFDLGHREFGIVTGPDADLATTERLAGTRSAFARRGLPFPESDVVRTDWSTADGYAKVGQLLERRPTTTAIIAHSDMLAVGAVRAARHRGLSVPDDISIAGFDDVDLAQYLDPGLTTVRQDPEAIGTRCLDALMQMIEHDARDLAPSVAPTTLIVRRSTGPVARGAVARSGQAGR